MNTAKLKAFAPKARRDLIRAVGDRAKKLGISEKGASDITIQGDAAIIEGQPYPRNVGEMREALRKRCEQEGFQRVVEAAAYTWFNRLMALRYMEVHGYLDHGFAVLSDPDDPENPDALPQILREADKVELPGVDRDTVIELKLDGNKDAELYRLLILGQCRALHKAMPFLFEDLDDETELLLPENLLHSGSIVRGLVNEIVREDWESIEIVGWLYQFYISEKKDEVIGKVVKSEDIPAATELFTPNWIVKYMVQNSLGAQWLATYPDSKLKSQMEFYIEPGEQTDEVKTQLAAITPRQLNPEELTLIDPASGSGHILVEAYELFKAIYLERGYRLRDVPNLILEKNLFGLDIDERAAQLTGFALTMKGRADDPELLERDVKLNVMAFVDSTGFDAEGLAQGVFLADDGPTASDLNALKDLFQHATTLGSLVEVPAPLSAMLPKLRELTALDSDDLFVSEALRRLVALVGQLELLAAGYDLVAANPPYMGRKYQTKALRTFAATEYRGVEGDLCTMFTRRSLRFSKSGGRVAMITMDSWLYGEDYRAARVHFSENAYFASLCHLGPHAFPEVKGEVVQTVAFVASPGLSRDYSGTYFDLVSPSDSFAKKAKFIRGEGKHHAAMSVFAEVPRGVFTAYRASASTLNAFRSSSPLKDISEAFTGLQTGDNPRFIRFWFEIDCVPPAGVRSTE
ncbi:BREX-1 system adenine-specific DNA-methyltransferase PglX [Myxococcota bacterium]